MHCGAPTNGRAPPRPGDTGLPCHGTVQACTKSHGNIFNYSKTVCMMFKAKSAKKYSHSITDTQVIKI